MLPAARTSRRSRGSGYDGPPGGTPPLTPEASSHAGGAHGRAPLWRGSTIDATRTITGSLFRAPLSRGARAGPSRGVENHGTTQGIDHVPLRAGAAPCV